MDQTRLNFYKKNIKITTKKPTCLNNFCQNRQKLSYDFNFKNNYIKLIMVLNTFLNNKHIKLEIDTKLYKKRYFINTNSIIKPNEKKTSKIIYF